MISKIQVWKWEEFWKWDRPKSILNKNKLKVKVKETNITRTNIRKFRRISNEFLKYFQILDAIGKMKKIEKVNIALTDIKSKIAAFGIVFVRGSSIVIVMIDC